MDVFCCSMNFNEFFLYATINRSGEIILIKQIQCIYFNSSRNSTKGYKYPQAIMLPWNWLSDSLKLEFVCKPNGNKQTSQTKNRNRGVGEY